MDFDTGTIANIAIAVSAVIALVFGIIQVRGAVRDRRERLTIEVIRSFGTREFAEQMVALRSRPPPSTVKEWRALTEAERTRFLQFGQAMEMLGLLVYDKIIDLDLVERTLGSFVSDTWSRFEPGLKELRVENKDPYLSEYFQWLARRVAERMETRPRRPAYEDP